MVLSKVTEHLLFFVIETVLCIITCILSGGLHTQNNNSTPATTQHYIHYI